MIDWCCIDEEADLSAYNLVIISLCVLVIVPEEKRRRRRRKKRLLFLLMVVMVAASGASVLILDLFSKMEGCLVAAAVITRSHLVGSYFPVGEWCSLFCDVKVREDDDESVAESKELGFVLLCFSMFLFSFLGFFFSFLSRNCLCWFFSRIFFFSHEGKEGRKEKAGLTGVE